jgi:signal transduction histidine kinase
MNNGTSQEKSEMTTPLRVLLIEDSEDDAMLLLRELRKGGYEPASERVETPESMTASLKKNHWDVVISDYVLPRFSGLAALNILKESGWDLPFIVVSGKIGEDVAVGAMKAGAHDYILKGNLTRLVPAVERELAECEVRRERKRAEEALKRSHEELEHRVKERTEELRASKRELERIVAELGRSNRELEQFAYVASHDLQEPLRMVTLFMQLLTKRLGDQLDDKAHEYVKHAVDGAQRMSQLIYDLLVFSRIRRGTWDPAPVDMNKVFQQVLADCRGSIEEAGARVTGGEFPVVQGEATQLGQLLQNLIANAVKFRRAGVAPEIFVSTWREGGEWVFAVRDNGIGISPEQRERVFQIFQRLHNREQYTGTGIGLAICQKVVEHHGGRIWIESTPGGGSTFLFTLPA